MKMKKKRNNALLVLAAVLMCYSCNRKDPDFRQISDGDLTLQLTRLPGAVKTEGSGFKFRIVPSKNFLAMHKVSTENFWFHMDSCFYTEDGHGKNYVAMAQPVSNGRRDDFEYLLQFDSVTTGKSDSVRLVYHDKFTSKKDYTFNIQL